MSAAAAILSRGGLVVFPTETVYGLGACALDRNACLRIFAAKGRPSDNPLIVHVHEIAAIDGVAELPEDARRIAERFMPGPLTLLLPKKKAVAGLVTGGLPEIGVRIPAHPVARELLGRCRLPVAAPSANISGRPSPTTFAMAYAAMNGRADAIIDGGDCQVGLESTVARVAAGRIEILRPGAVTAEDLEAVGIEVVPLYSDADHPPASRPSAPGMKYTHYRPSAELVLYEEPEALLEWLSTVPAAVSEKTGLIFLGAAPRSEPRELHDAVVTDLSDYGRRLFALFHEFDRQGCERIAAPLPADRGLGRALRNRLLKAAGGRVLRRGAPHDEPRES